LIPALTRLGLNLGDFDYVDLLSLEMKMRRMKPWRKSMVVFLKAKNL